jgi:hypothetical protein
MALPSWSERLAETAASRRERTKLLVDRLRNRATPETAEEPAPTPAEQPVEPHSAGSVLKDRDFTVATVEPNEDLTYFVNLLDEVASSDRRLHAALLWPHIPPRAILPWMLREVSRGRVEQPLRTLLLNMGRPALQAVADIGARTERLHARGLFRSGVVGDNVPGAISADALFYMFLGDRQTKIESVPLVSIVPHTVALNDGTYWRDFDEKTLKGFKRLYPSGRLNSVRGYLDLLGSAVRSPAFAFLLPSHFPDVDRKRALRSMPGSIDLALIDMTTHALRGRDASALIRMFVSELSEAPRQPPKRVLILADCPLRYSFIRRSLRTYRGAGALGSRTEGHNLVWATRGRGFEAPGVREAATQPIVETIGSKECVIATRFWNHAKQLDEGNPLASMLKQGAIALKGMALTASGADAILAPYTDVHDVYHRVKRERHSFEPHYNKAMASVADGHAGPWRDAIQADLSEGLGLAGALRAETPLMRYLKRVLTEISPCNDVVIVLRHPEDAQQAGDRLLDFLTAPGSFVAGVPELRITTPGHYTSEVQRKKPTVVIWAASTDIGARSYIGDAYCPSQFRLVVAGHDALTLSRVLDAAVADEYALYAERVGLLRKALPWVAKEYGGLSVAHGLDSDRSPIALPFVGHGFLVLDGYGKIAAGPGSQFYVLDPASHRLAPKEARSIDSGDAVFVMPDAIREEIEAALREKDDKGRTLEQALVDQYKATVKKGIETLTAQFGAKGLTVRVRDMLFEQNPGLPSISKPAVEYWLRAAERSEVDTPHAAINPLHIEAFLRLMGAGVLARSLTDAVRIVRTDLRRDGHASRGLFDRLLLDADSVIQGPLSSFAKLQGVRRAAIESVFPVLEKHLDNASAASANEPIFQMAAQ